MADSAATMALETLRDLLIEEAKFLSSESGRVEEVRRQLKTMHSFLKVAHKMTDKSKSETVREWIVQLRGLSIDAENILERYAIEVKSKRETAKLKQVLKRFICVLCECLTVHPMGREIKDIRSRMADLTKKAEHIITKGESASSASADDDVPYWSRRTYGHEVEEHFVGMKEDIKQLESLMTSEERSNRVISICGMGGLGKTTLATKIYNGEAVRRCFQARAWVCISQQFQPKIVFQELLKQLLPNEARPETEYRLVRKLHHVQREKKCLVVLDDIWEVEHWNSLSRAFPIRTSSCCKVLLTSRNDKIAATERVYKLECLSEDEGWDLLQKIAHPINYSQERPIIELEFKRLEEIGREMIRKCGRFPLAISVIGGILRQEKTISSAWEKVCKDIDSYLQSGRGVEENIRVKQVLDLSYKMLPYNLKPCFLYLGCFPEERQIYPHQLYLLWMAEGMVSPEDGGTGETLRDIAERYLSELAHRFMVQVTMGEYSIYNKFISCRLHDLMRELCLLKGQEEEFFEVVDGQMERQDASSIRRLAIHLDEAVDYELGSKSAKNLRSLLVLPKQRIDGGVPVSIEIGICKFLKTLILRGCRFPERKLPKGIENMILLKHLSIEDCDVDELPQSVCELPRLQSLDLQHLESYGVIKISNSIHKMQRLKYLFLSFESRNVIGGGKLKLDSLNELETLIGFDSSVDDIGDLSKFVKLRVFMASIHDEDCLSMIIDYILNHQDQFRDLKFIIEKNCNVMINSEAEYSTLLKKTLMCRSLCLLMVNCLLGEKLPPYESQLGRNLLWLYLYNSYMEEDPMGMLEKLPMLRYLDVSNNAFVGRVMVCRATGFPQLRSLELRRLANLVEWRVEEKAMPNLSSLAIHGCKRLRMIPEGLKFITDLKQLTLYDMPREFADRVQVVDGQPGEDYDKIKHVPSIKLEHIGRD